MKATNNSVRENFSKSNRRMPKLLILALAMVAVLGISTTVYAAVGNQGVNKVGDKYVVDTVTSETTVDGVLVQTVERKWIPEDRYDPNNPRTPKSSSGTPVGSKTEQLRNAGINSRNDLQTYGWNYQWSTTPTELSANDSEVKTNVVFQVDASASADRWRCEFVQVVKFDSKGNPYVEYYIGNTKYSPDSIKRMFVSYGKAR